MLKHHLVILRATVGICSSEDLWNATWTFLRCAEPGRPLSGAVRNELNCGVLSCSGLTDRVFLCAWWALSGSVRVLTVCLVSRPEESTQRCPVQVRMEETPSAFCCLLCGLVSYFFKELPLKATVCLKIETIPPLGCGLVITTVLYGIFAIHLCRSFFFFLDEA